jgi:hypothetical protein
MIETLGLLIIIAMRFFGLTRPQLQSLIFEAAPAARAPLRLTGRRQHR